MVLGLCRLLLRDPLEAEDAAQQVFLSAHRAMLGGLLPRDPPAWLATIARNECRGRIRARMREPQALSYLPDDLPDPLAAAIRAVDLDAVWAALSELPRRQRRALMLRELGGLSYHELGRALGVSQSAVESLLFRARRHLRSLVTGAGANAAAVPFSLRDELARRIPEFDPGSVALAARVATAPVALKLATAAVGIGVVATGAAHAPEHHAVESRTGLVEHNAGSHPGARPSSLAVSATETSPPAVGSRGLEGRGPGMPDQRNREQDRRKRADEDSLQVESRRPAAATESTDHADRGATVQVEAESHGSDRPSSPSPSEAPDPTDGAAPSGAPSGPSGSDESDSSGH
jgi:RNA polymerase sigma factor (sigma-70 family)